jgi:hypothetical protein
VCIYLLNSSGSQTSLRVSVTYLRTKQDRQCTYNVTMRRVRELLLSSKRKNCSIRVFVSVGVRACVCVRAWVGDRKRGCVNARARV